jgi:hypothetical protein
MIARTIKANLQFMMIMKMVEVAIFITAQVESSKPQVISSATRSVSEVTRDINQPTGVWLK